MKISLYYTHEINHLNEAQNDRPLSTLYFNASLARSDNNTCARRKLRRGARKNANISARPRAVPHTFRFGVITPTRSLGPDVEHHARARAYVCVYAREHATRRDITE